MTKSTTDILTYLKEHEQKQLLRFVAVGSVDDGKSTLIGRLLHDASGVYEDQLADARQGAGEGAEIDFALITDGLAAEREQGITIDVAYRYFSTPKRKFIIADTPGHVQYTRNMATGASTANVAIILIDARLGVLRQSRRHAFIASLLGIPHLLVAINKMDLVDFSEARFEELKADFTQVSRELGFKDVTFIPVSALEGDNVVTSSAKTPWYRAGTLLNYLETVDIGEDRNLAHFRFPVQYVIRPDLDYRGFAGQVVSGHVVVGDEVTVLPSGKTSRVKAIDTFSGELKEAFPPMSVTLRLEDEIDISRGDILAHPGDLPEQVRTFDAHVVWMAEKPLDTAKSYLIKHTSRYIRAGLHQVAWKLDMDTLEEVPSEFLQLNDIGRVTVTCHRAVYCDPYPENRHTGAFIIIDTMTNGTVGAGMIIEAAAHKGTCSGEESGVSRVEREERVGHSGMALVLSGTGVTAKLAYSLERRLFDLGCACYVVNVPTAEAAGDGLYVAAACVDAGLVTICRFPQVAPADITRLFEEGHSLIINIGQTAGSADLTLEDDELPQLIGGIETYLRENGVLPT